MLEKGTLSRCLSKPQMLRVPWCAHHVEEARDTPCQFRGKVGRVGVMLNSLVNLMSSRIAWKMGLWANCDVGGGKTFSLVGGTILWAGELNREKRRKQVVHWHSSLSASWLWMQYDPTAASYSCLDFPTMGCTVSLNYELKPPSLKLILSGCFVSMTEKETMTVGDLPESYTALIRVMDRRSEWWTKGQMKFQMGWFYLWTDWLQFWDWSQDPLHVTQQSTTFNHLSQCWQVFGEDALPGAVPCLHVLLITALHLFHCRLRISFVYLPGLSTPRRVL